MGTVAAEPPEGSTAAAHRPHDVSPEEERILAYASAIGREFDFGLLTRATGIDEERVVERLEQLVHRRFLRERLGGDRFAFANEEERVRIYQSLTASRLRVLHRKVAEAMEATDPDPSPEVIAELGRHYFLGKFPEKSYEFNRRGAELARHDRNPELLANHLERIRIDLASLPGDHANEYTDLLQELGDLYFDTGDDERADSLFAEGLERVEASDAVRRARFLLARGEIARERLSVDAARRFVEEARALFLGAGDLAGAAGAHRVLGRIHFERGEYREALEEGLAALDLLRDSPDERVLGRLCTDIGNAFASLGPEMATEADAWYRRAIAHLEAVDDWVELARAYHNLGAMLGDARPQAGLEQLERARQYAERAHDRRWTAWTLFTGVEMRLAVGQTEEAERDNQQARGLLERSGDPVGLQQVARNRGLIAERRGEWEEAEAAYREALDRAERAGVPPEVADSHFALARLHYKLRNFSAAREHLEAARRGRLTQYRPARARAFRELERTLASEGLPDPTAGPAKATPPASEG
ncbi:MAG TPA: tetratricopeptide repeat protein [Thermoplasmata archaeon]|nr:tetratricopeptide repeat protein [Thermoplasmata archaeon]